MEKGLEDNQVESTVSDVFNILKNDHTASEQYEFLCLLRERLIGHYGEEYARLESDKNKAEDQLKTISQHIK